MIFGYNGRDGVVTDNNGLIYLRARYYSPEMKRFLHADIVTGEISNAITLNRFAYANGNPVSFVDPFGLGAERGTEPLINYYTVVFVSDKRESSGLPIGGILKKYIAFLIICATVFLCACSSYENANFIGCEDGQCLVYQGEKYFAAPGFVTAEGFEHANADNIQLGYFYSFPFSTYFYSYTLENPDYISTAGSDTGVYFKEDYAYQTDTFVIVGTEHEFVFSDALTLSTAFAHQGWESYQGEIEITLSPQKHPRIQMPVRVFCIGDIWFACGRQKNALFEVSDDFVKMFTDCNQ